MSTVSYFKIIHLWRKGKWRGNFVVSSIGDHGGKAGRSFKIDKYLRLLFSALSKTIELRFWLAILRRQILLETFFKLEEANWECNCFENLDDRGILVANRCTV